MNRSLFFFAFFCLLTKVGFSQNIEIKGSVIDEKTNVPIPFANVVVKNAFIGTVTNEIGQFRLILPLTILSNNLEISSIGYYSVTLSIEDNKSKELTVKLIPRSYELAEVVVLPNGLTPKRILEKSVRNFRRHIAESSYMQDFFYRELTLTRDTFSFLMEAASEVCYPRFTIEDNKIRIKVNKIRRSSYFGDIETNWFYKTVSKKLWGKIDNGIYFFWDKYRLVVSKLQDFDVDKLDSSVVNLKGLTFIDSTKVYEIQLDFEYGTTNYFIRSDNYQTIKIIRGFKVPKVVTVSTKGLIDGIYLEKLELNFNQFGRRQVFSHGTLKSMPHSSSYTSFKGDYFQMQEIQVVANRTLFSGYKNISKKESLGVKANLYELEYKYDSTFWNNYNGIILNPLLVQQKNDLERGVTLEQQFIQNQKPVKQ